MKIVFHQSGKDLLVQAVQNEPEIKDTFNKREAIGAPKPKNFDLNVFHIAMSIQKHSH